MELISIIMNVVIKNDVVISEIWVWLCGQRESGYDPYLISHTFIYKLTYDKPTEGAFIQLIDDLIPCSNIVSLFHIFLFLYQLLEGILVQRDPALQCSKVPVTCFIYFLKAWTNIVT